MTFIEKVVAAIEESERSGRMLVLDGPAGLAGERTAGLLQRCAALAAADGACYVEVGVFRGYTLCSVAAAAPEMACFGIDNFVQFDPAGENRRIVSEGLARHAHGNAVLIDADFEEALRSLPERIGARRIAVYFVDGPHDYRSQFLSLELARPHFAPQAVIVIDDCNYEHVRRANADWLRCNPEFALLFEAYSAAHPDHLSGPQLVTARAGWWNGVNVLVRDPSRSLPRTHPPVDPSRQRYFNDHIVHAARYAELAPELLDALGSGSFGRLIRSVIGAWGRFAGRYPRANTYSDQLPSRRIVQPRSDPAVEP